MQYIVYGMQGCNWCVRAQNLIRNKGLKPTYVDILEVPEARDFIVEQEGHRTVPQVYTENAMGIKEHIGGYEALEEHFKKITH